MRKLQFDDADPVDGIDNTTYNTLYAWNQATGGVGGGRLKVETPHTTNGLKTHESAVLILTNTAAHFVSYRDSKLTEDE